MDGAYDGGVEPRTNARVALTRPVSATLDRCQLTHLERTPIDVALARAQHAAYEAVLEELGCRLERLPALDDHPDAVFVEDCAVVLDELAVATRPGAPARRAEVASVAEAISRHRPVVRLESPAALDGGDVLRLGRTLFVGRTSRSDRAGATALAAAVEPSGYRVVVIPVTGCLHLKSAATSVDDGVVLVNPQWVDPRDFSGHEWLEVDPSEPHAANALRIGRTVVVAAAFGRTRDRLEARGIEVRAVDLSQLALAEGAVTCCSVIIEAPGGRAQSGRR